MKKHIKFAEYVEENDDEEQDGYDDGFGAETKKWHQGLPDEPLERQPLTSDRIEALKNEANSILHGESTTYETKMDRSGSSDQKWAKALLTKGATGDRVAAAVVLIQDNPIFHLNILRNLVGNVKPAKKKDSLIIIETLVELFLNDLLLPEAKLRKFETHPFSKLDEMSSGNRDHRKKILMYWIFEDHVKEIYGEFIKSLNSFAHDTIEAHKEKAISAMSKLLKGNPEYEKVLLSNIVNKLGDPSQKVASKVIYHLCQILYAHPNMKGVVLEEIEKMLFRSNISSKAQYYGICFLNQFFLSKDDSSIAENLVRVYFSFFKACIKKGDIDTRLMSAILTGVKRCQPFLSQQKVEELQEQADALHRLVHLARYNVSLHALALLLQIAPVATQLSDRYYCALYKKLADPETLTTTLPALMMNLAYRSIKADQCFPRVLAFLKRLLQLACLSDAPRACAFLLLIARLSKNKRLPVEWMENDPEIKEEEEKLEANDEPVEASDASQTEIHEDNLKKPVNESEPKANVLQSLWKADKAELLNDEDETYQDIILEEDEAEFKKKFNKMLKKKSSVSHGWVHKTLPETEISSNVKLEETPDAPIGTEKSKELEILIKKSKNVEKKITTYLPLSRNPAYCGAENSVVCELLQLLNHFHPTVRLFAEKVLSGKFIQYGGDPLKDFSIARFLDRFAFKNPKKDLGKEKYDDAEAENVKGSHPKFAQRKNYQPGGIRSLPVNSNAYLNEDASHIPIDERYLYDYLHMQREKKGDEDPNAESDNDSVNSDDFNSYLDSLGGKKALEDSEDDSDDEGVDFMTDVLQTSKSQKVSAKDKKKVEEDEDSNEEGSDWSQSDDNGEDEAFGEIDDDDSDLEFSDEDVKEKKNKKSKSTENESDIDFSSDDEEEGFDIPNIKSKAKGKSKSKKGAGIESMFASAEEFSTLLEDSAATKGHGTSHELSNAENAHSKQLSWETDRDRWVKGYKGKSNKKAGASMKFEKRTVGQGNRKRKFDDGKQKKRKKAKF